MKNVLTEIANPIPTASWMPYGLRERDRSDPIWDFRVIPHGTNLYKRVLLPDSKPALEWCWSNLNEASDRYAQQRWDGVWVHGYIIHEDEIDAVVLGMQRDQLMSYEEYEEAEEEMARQFAQMEDY